MEYILNVRSFFALLYKEVSVKYILRFPHHSNRSFAGVIVILYRLIRGSWSRPSEEAAGARSAIEDTRLS